VFAYISVILACFYFVLAVIAFWLLVRLSQTTRCNQGRTHKSFFGFVSVYAVARLMDALTWTVLNADDPNCDTPSGDNRNPMLQLVGDLLPNAFFISALSTNIHIVSRLYHVVAHEQPGCFRLFSGFLWFTNGVLYLLSFIWVGIEVQKRAGERANAAFSVAVQATTASVEFSVAIMQVLYSGLLLKMFPYTMGTGFLLSALCAFSLCAKGFLRVLLVTTLPWEFVLVHLGTELFPMAMMLFLEARGSHRLFATAEFNSYGSAAEPIELDPDRVEQSLITPGRSTDPTSG